MSSLRNFFTGFSYPLKGISFIFSNPEVSKYIILQFVINAVVFVISFSLTFIFYTRWLSSLVSDNKAWYMIVVYIASLILGLFLLIIINIFITGILGGVIGGGLNSKISRRTEEIKKNELLKDDIGFFDGLSRDIGYEIKSLIMILSVYVILLPVNLIPFLGSIIYLVLSFLYSLFALCFKFWDYPMERRRLSFKQKLSIVMHSKGYFPGFGLASFILLMVPIVNFLIPSVCIISGTLLYLDKLEDNSSK